MRDAMREGLATHMPDMGSEADAAARPHRRRPEGLWPKSPLAALLALRIFPIWAAAGA